MVDKKKLNREAVEDILAEAHQKGSPPDFSKADLSGVSLNSLDLSFANLIETNLYRADLYKTILRQANLYLADLSRANLKRTDFVIMYTRPVSALKPFLYHHYRLVFF